MKSINIIFFLILTFIPVTFELKAQNDSVLPNYEANYSLFQMSFDAQFNWVYYPENISFYNYDEDDTLDVGINPIAKIILENNKAYILSIQSVSSFFIYQDSAVVLYDFGLNVGDTAYFEDNTGFGIQDTPVVVEDVLFETIQGQDHKKIVLSNQDIWVQGIGSLIHPLWPVMSHFEVNYLFCNANLFYVNQGNYHDLNYNYQDCSWIGINEIEKPQKKIIQSVDLLGRPVEPTVNNILIQIYDDGTTQKVIKID